MIFSTKIPSEDNIFILSDNNARKIALLHVFLWSFKAGQCIESFQGWISHFLETTLSHNADWTNGKPKKMEMHSKQGVKEAKEFKYTKVRGEKKNQELLGLQDNYYIWDPF